MTHAVSKNAPNRLLILLAFFTSDWPFFRRCDNAGPISPVAKRRTLSLKPLTFGLKTEVRNS